MSRASWSQQGAQLLNDGIQLVLVAQPPAAEELLMDPHAVRLVQRFSKVVDDYKHLVQFLHFQLLGRLRDLALLMRRSAASSHSSQ